jgi:hypothetical protein
MQVLKETLSASRPVSVSSFALAHYIADDRFVQDHAGRYRVGQVADRGRHAAQCV